MTQHADVTTDTPHRAGRATARIPAAARGGAAAGALAALALVLAACGSSASSSATTSPSANRGAGATTTGGSTTTPTVKTASTSQGTVLVNSSGMALYTYGPDHGAAQSTCTGTCIQAWPPLTVPAGTTPTPGAGVTGTLGTSRQSNGSLQVTYNGNLLYTFLSDPSPGQVTGNGVGGFSVAKVAVGSSSGSATTASSGGPASTTTTASSGYRY